MKASCQICNRERSQTELIPSEVISQSLLEIIKQRYPDWNTKGFICKDDLQKFRRKYFSKIIQDEMGELSALETDVVNKLTEHESISINVEEEFVTKLTFGEKLSDHIASFGGSWKFIILFGLIILGWISVNSYLLLARPFDPYPFILLNLVLSCLAALQAPVIMMSQNRQEARDRLRAENDYKINLKAELELRQLHQKVCHLLTQQWERMIEIQQLQMDMLEEIKKPRSQN